MKSCTPPNLGEARADCSGVDHPLAEVDASSSASSSFGEISSSNRLQPGTLSADNVLSTLVRPVHDVSGGNALGGDTSPDALRERTPYNECDIAHVPSSHLMDEGEEEREEGEDR